MDTKTRFYVYIIVASLLIFLSNYLLTSDSLYYGNLSEQLTYEQIEGLLQKTRKWEWLSYAILPAIYLVKLSLVATCLSVGMLFVNSQFEFKKMFGVALTAEFVFLIPSILKILWFTLFQTDYTLTDLQLFYPLSALSLFDEAAVQKNQAWLVYPLQTLNVFELAYWLLLAKGVSEALNRDFTRSFELVMASYGSALVLWIVTVMFLTVTYGA